MFHPNVLRVIKCISSIKIVLPFKSVMTMHHIAMWVLYRYYSSSRTIEKLVMINHTNIRIITNLTHFFCASKKNIRGLINYLPKRYI